MDQFGRTLSVVNWFSNEVWAINPETFAVTAPSEHFCARLFEFFGVGHIEEL
jgi:hypothetical protein